MRGNDLSHEDPQVAMWAVVSTCITARPRLGRLHLIQSQSLRCMRLVPEKLYEEKWKR